MVVKTKSLFTCVLLLLSNNKCVCAHGTANMAYLLQLNPPLNEVLLVFEQLWPFECTQDDADRTARFQGHIIRDLKRYKRIVVLFFCGETKSHSN